MKYLQRIGPRAQSIAQLFGFGILLCLAVLAILTANRSSSKAGSAAQDTQAGTAACKTQAANYASSVKVRKLFKTELLTTAKIRAETSKVFRDLANLSPKASAGQTKILNLALSYAAASATSRSLASQVVLPIKPDCLKVIDG